VSTVRSEDVTLGESLSETTALLFKKAWTSSSPMMKMKPWPSSSRALEITSFLVETVAAVLQKVIFVYAFLVAALSLRAIRSSMAGGSKPPEHWKRNETLYVGV
jgi:hypothetical protein